MRMTGCHTRAQQTVVTAHTSFIGKVAPLLGPEGAAEGSRGYDPRSTHSFLSYALEGRWT